jgi:PAS domain S-box-containing protein
MNSNKIALLERTLKREKAARKIAENILEKKSRALYKTSEELKEVNAELAHLLGEKSSQLAGIFENINDAYVIIDLNGNVLKFNNIAETLFGYSIDKERLNIVDLIYPLDIEYALASFKTLQQEAYFSNYNARIITKSKEVKWVHINASIIFNSKNEPIAAQGIVRDKTSEKEAEKKQLESEDRLKTLIVNLDSGVLLESEERKIILTNKKFCQLFAIQVEPEVLIGEDCSNAAEQNKVLFENPVAFITRINEILAAKIPVIGDELIMNNGKVLERNFIPIYSNSEYQGHLWTYRDVSLKKIYNKSLEAQKQKYSNIIANMNLGLVEVDTEDKIIMTNHTFIKMSGYAEEELLGQYAHKLFPFLDERGKLLKEKTKRQKGKATSYEIKVKNKAGQTRHWLISGAPNYNIHEEIVGFIGINLDITKIKELELQKENLLHDLEKSNDELHEYAHVVSHDLKSPLRSIDALVNWLKTDNIGVLDELSLQNISLIEMTLEKMELLIKDVLNYSSLGSSINMKKEVNVMQVVKELEKILLIPAHISLKINTELPTILGEKTKISQLFQNLISNSIKFMDKEKGLITISAKEYGDYYEFCVRDNGIGINKKFHKSIFKIFHSLNKSENSSGIGLSIVKKIVNLHKGIIWVESIIKKGTAFYFTLSKK